ncbi:hypothetical protein F5888DRAFT_1805212 [Russula emetica]|nr:hypothetical protein F5888DRAFT_1805212 [Russula emetica]
MAGGNLYIAADKQFVDIEMGDRPLSQLCAPSIPPPRDDLLPSILPSDASPPSQIPPEAVPAFLPTPEHPPSVPHAPASTAQVPAEQQCTLLTLAPRDYFSLHIPAPASPLPPKQARHTVEASPHARANMQADPAPKTSRSEVQAAACLVYRPRQDLPPPIPVQTSITPSPVVLAPFQPFPPAPQSFPSVQQGTALSTSAPPSQCDAPPASLTRHDLLLLSVASATPSAIRTPPRPIEALQQAQTAILPAPVKAAAAKIDTLLQAIEALKASLQAIISGQRTAEAHAMVQRVRQKKAPHCKFCGKAGHIIKECEEVDEYLLTGKCKRNTSGRIVLSSGAELPHTINPRTLQEYCDAYHRQNPTIQPLAEPCPEHIPASVA